MTVLVNETFATGIPGGFATIRNDGGNLTATWNSGAQAVDLANANLNSVWEFNVAAQAAVSMELDIELIAIGTGSPLLAGFFNQTSASVTNAFWLQAGIISACGIGIAGGGGYGFTTQTYQFGGPITNRVTRHLYRYETWLYSGQRYGAFYLDNELIGFHNAPNSAATVKCSINARDGTYRLHNVYITDTPDTSLTPRVYGNPRGILLAETGRKWDQVRPATTFVGRAMPRGFRSTIWAKNRGIYGSGSLTLGKITGTTKQAPATPTGALVRLHRDSDGLLVAQTYSDAVTGAYEFLNVDIADKYTALAYDLAHNFRAVVADNLTPDPM